MTWRHLPGVLEFTMVYVEHGRPVRFVKWNGTAWMIRAAGGEYRLAFPGEVPEEVQERRAA